MASCLSSNRVVTPVDDTSTTGAAPLTVTRSLIAPGTERRVDRRRKAETDVDAIVDDGGETGELEGQGVDPGRHRREAVDATGLGDRGPRGDQRRTGQADPDTGNPGS